MQKRAIVCSLLVLIGLGGCQRPQGVLEVARLSMPVVVRLQRDGSALDDRMAIQRSIFQARAASLVAREGDARAQARTVERDWRIAGEKGQLDRMAVVREGDEWLLSDPLGPVKGPPPAPAETNAVDTSGLKKTITSLDRLRGQNRSSFGDLLTFAAAVNAEVKKLAEQAPDEGKSQ